MLINTSVCHSKKKMVFATSNAKRIVRDGIGQIIIENSCYQIVIHMCIRNTVV